MTYYHRNIWPWGRTVVINTHNGAGTVRVAIENHDPLIADIMGLSVVPEERHGGYGHELLGLAEQEAILMGATSVQLTAVEGEFTLEWYQREGYKIVRFDKYMHCTVLRKTL